MTLTHSSFELVEKASIETNIDEKCIATVVDSVGVRNDSV
jgi:hypothetical protein